jgi:hypothetical protein
VNLFDLTRGNYRLQRTISYPDFPESRIVTDAQVTAVSDSEWLTTITISGTYNGPTDIVSVEDYHLIWTAHAKEVLESGTALLGRADVEGGSIRQVWSSTITPEKVGVRLDDGEKAKLERLKGGEVISLSISPLQIEGNRMSYTWEGTVSRLPKHSCPD